MLFEWDEQKEKINIDKHGIDFKTASHVFMDPNRIELYDELHSDLEDRYITIGKVGSCMMIITLVYTERTQHIRIISARMATNKERKAYYDDII